MSQLNSWLNKVNCNSLLYFIENINQKMAVIGIKNFYI